MVDEEDIELVDELLFDTVVEEVSVVEVVAASELVIDPLGVSDPVPHAVGVSDTDGVFDILNDPLLVILGVFVSVYDIVLSVVLELVTVSDPLLDCEFVVLTVFVIPVGKVVILVVGVLISVVLTEYVIVGLVDFDIEGEDDVECVFVCIALNVVVIVDFPVGVGFTDDVIVVVALVVFDIVDEDVYVTVLVEVLELLVDPVIVGLCVDDFEGRDVYEAKDVSVMAPVLEGVFVPFAVPVIVGVRVNVIVVVGFDFPVVDSVLVTAILGELELVVDGDAVADSLGVSRRVPDSVDEMRAVPVERIEPVFDTDTVDVLELEGLFVVVCDFTIVRLPYALNVVVFEAFKVAVSLGVAVLVFEEPSVFV